MQGNVQDEIDSSLVEKVLDEAGISKNRAIFGSMIGSLFEMAGEEVDSGNLKIARAALEEMADAFRMFRPFRDRRKVTIFGSARIGPDHVSYAQAQDLANKIAGQGWMVVTGAGPGIMEAGMAGAGQDNAIGVLIRLPFESPNRFIASDPKLVEMKYFFTRKLMLMKESHAFAVLPGGFGTLDETYEVLTLLQTGKAQPAPVILIDEPGGGYWDTWTAFIMEQLIPRGLVAPEDRSLFSIADDVNAAVDQITQFYSTYHSCRWVGDLLVIRLTRPISPARLEELNREYSTILAGGAIRATDPLPPERASRDNLELPRIAMRFDRRHYGRLREFINSINRGD